MNKAEKAKIVQKILYNYFPNPTIPLHHSNPYTLLIAVLLSAQCTDARVNLVTPYLFNKASTPEEMIKLTIQEVTDLIRSCGLSNNKAKAIWNLSKQLIEKHNACVPSNYKDLEALPGVGHKTASVVMSQAFHIPAFPIDTHIHRCAKRWGLSKGKNVIETERDLKAIFPEKKWNKIHLQIIYFARKYCPARGHKQENCPICSILHKS